jgi:hypothetical protein
MSLSVSCDSSLALFFEFGKFGLLFVDSGLDFIQQFVFSHCPFLQRVGFK